MSSTPKTEVSTSGAASAAKTMTIGMGVGQDDVRDVRPLGADPLQPLLDSGHVSRRSGVDQNHPITYPDQEAAHVEVHLKRPGHPCRQMDLLNDGLHNCVRVSRPTLTGLILHHGGESSHRAFAAGRCGARRTSAPFEPWHADSELAKVLRIRSGNATNTYIGERSGPEVGCHRRIFRCLQRLCDLATGDGEYND